MDSLEEENPFPFITEDTAEQSGSQVLTGPKPVCGIPYELGK